MAHHGLTDERTMERTLWIRLNRGSQKKNEALLCYARGKYTENKACHWGCAPGLGIGAELAYHLLALQINFPFLEYLSLRLREPDHGTICYPVHTVQFLSQ